MFLLTVLAIAAFALVIVAARQLGVGSVDTLGGLFIFPTELPRARGIQEEDLPRFVFKDAGPVEVGPAQPRPASGRVLETKAA